MFLILIEFARQYALKNGPLYVINTQDLRFSFHSETWKYIREESDNFTFIKVQALVAKELHFRILAKFHAKVTKSKTTFKVVASKEKGINWLQQKMKENND